MKTVVIYFTFFFGVAHGVRELPAFFKTCKATEPKMQECIMQKSKETLPELLKGVKEFKIPSFLPLKLKEVKVDAGNVVLKLSDFSLYGLDSAELKSVDMDVNKRSGLSQLYIKQLQINGTYDVDGQILILPIKGHGPGFIQFDDILIDIDLGYDTVEMPEEKQYHYVKMSHLKLDYTVGNAFFKFDNLFGGDKTLGDEMHKFVNENWREFNKDVRPAIISVIETVVMKIVKGILELVPIEKLFPQ